MSPVDGKEPFVDVRMRGFTEKASVEDVFRLLESRISPLTPERVAWQQMAGRVLAEPVIAAVNVPAFDRAAMDGFAVQAADTASASHQQPVSLTIIGEAFPARPFSGVVGPQEAVRIMTGSPLPRGADAVLPVECTAHEPGSDFVLAREPIAQHRHVGRIGEDVPLGQVVLNPGRRLRPQDVGLLVSMGVAEVSVIRRPRVVILVTGDELLHPGAVPVGYRIVDSNSPMLTALVARDGGDCLPVQYLEDRFETVREKLAAVEADVVLVSGGTSVGKEDHAPRAVAELGELPIHGVSIRPASPMGVGFLPGNRTVFLLPGNPVACLCAYDLFAGRALRQLGGLSPALPYRIVRYPLNGKIASPRGRFDYVRVRVVEERAEPVPMSGASILNSTVSATGFTLLDAAREGVTSGEVIEVYLYD